VAFVVDFGASHAGVRRLGPALAVDSGLFGLFAAHHSLMARTWAKRGSPDSCRPSLERAIYVWVASALFILLCAAWQPLPGLAWRATGLAALVALGLQALGALMLCGAARSLDVRSLVGIALHQARRAASRVRGRPPRTVVRPRCGAVGRTDGCDTPSTSGRCC